jgi:methylglyoxal reductase
MLTEFHPLAGKYKVTIGQLIIAWTFAQPGLTHVLCGVRNVHQAIENARSGSLNLAPDDINQMRNIAKASFPQGLPK